MSSPPQSDSMGLHWNPGTYLFNKCTRSDAGGPQVTHASGWEPCGRIQLSSFLHLHKPNETDESRTKKEDFGIKTLKTSTCQVAVWSLPRHKRAFRAARFNDKAHFKSQLMAHCINPITRGL